MDCYIGSRRWKHEKFGRHYWQKERYDMAMKDACLELKTTKEEIEKKFSPENTLMTLTSPCFAFGEANRAKFRRENPNWQGFGSPSDWRGFENTSMATVMIENEENIRRKIRPTRHDAPSKKKNFL